MRSELGRQRPSLWGASAVLALSSLGLGLAEWFLLTTRSVYGPKGVTASLAVITLATGIYLALTVAVMLLLHLPFWLRRKREFHKKLVIVPIGIVVCALWNHYPAPLPSAPKAKQQKNIVLVTLDTLRPDFLGCYGNNLIKTPCLDRLARRNSLFAEVVCSAPMTTPSHASILTSTHPIKHGAQDNRYRLSERNESLAEILREAGYTTGAFVSCFPLAKRFGLDQGFQVYDDRFIPHGGINELAVISTVHRFMRKHELERSAALVNQAALPWLRAHAGEPFFLWVHYFDPHAPYHPVAPYDAFYTEQFTKVYGRGYEASRAEVARACGLPQAKSQNPLLPVERYAGEVSLTDAALEDLLAELASLDVQDETMIVVTADHGESLGEHDYYYSHGALLFDPSIVVPLLISGVKDQRANLVVGNQVRLIDITPTILAELGLAKGAGMDGVSLHAQIRAGVVHESLPALVENIGIVLAPGAHKLRSLRAGGYKVINNEESGQCAGFYELATDPNELHDLCGNNKELSATMLDLMTQAFTSQAESRIEGELDLDEEVRSNLEQLGYIK